MKKSIALILMVILFSVGCNGYESTTEKKLGKVSDCEVSKIYLQNESYPIFIAKCKEVITTTSYYDTGGKAHQTIPIATVTIVEKEQAELAKKQSALGKLSDEEKKILGLK